MNKLLNAHSGLTRQKIYKSVKISAFEPLKKRFLERKISLLRLFCDKQ